MQKTDTSIPSIPLVSNSDTFINNTMTASVLTLSKSLLTDDHILSRDHVEETENIFSPDISSAYLEDYPK